MTSFRALALSSCAALALSIGVAGLASADAPRNSAVQTVQFQITVQSLASALSEFARQSGRQLLFTPDIVAGKTANAVEGTLPPLVALDRLIGGSGLTYTLTSSGAILLRDPARAAAATDSNASESIAEPEGNQEADSQGEKVERVVVTGSRIRGNAPAGANVIVIDRGAIEDTGQSTVYEVLRTLPQNYPGSQSEASQLNSNNNNLSFGSAIDLRGLGSDATLTLVNGRRIAPAGFGNFVDVSAIPVSAISRIEILADGASATYGSDAVGGVVNIITRQDFSGAETRFRVGAAEGGAEEINFGQLFGRDWTSGYVTVGYEYRHRDNLAAAERAFAATSDLRSLGGDNFDRTTSSPGTITRIGTTNVLYAIPEGQNGTNLSQADLIAGVANLQNIREGTDSLPEQESHSLFASARQALTSRIDLFFDALATDRQAFMRNSAIMSNITVPQSNYWRQANNLFPGQGNMVIAYSFIGDSGPTTFDTEAQTFSGVLGAEIDLGGDWSAEATSSYSRHRDYVNFGNSIDTAALNVALASSSATTAFNPFADGGANDAILGSIVRHQVTDNDSRLAVFALKADGPLFQLPAGEVRAALGVEKRDESFRVDRVTYSNAGVPTVVATPAPGERETYAAFAELAIPLVRDGSFLFLRDLDLSASVRREESDDYGRAVTPKFGVRWGLSEDLALRGSWGLSFKAPRFDQTLVSIGGSLLVLTPAQDPQADDGSTGLLFITGGNPDLVPEESENWTIGFNYAPAAIENLRLQATYFDVDFTNRIALPAGGDVLAAIANPAPYGSVLIRDPSQQTIDNYLAILHRLGGAMPADGIELIWDGRLTNLSSVRVRGIDMSAGFAFETSFGDFDLTAGASHLLQFERKANSLAPGEDILNTLFNPVDWRGRASIAYLHDDWRALLSMNYLSNYTDTVSDPDRDIDSWTTFDLRVTRRWNSATESTGDEGGFEVAFNVQNLFDEDPPFVNSTEGLAYDTRNTHPLGRFMSVELKQRW